MTLFKTTEELCESITISGGLLIEYVQPYFQDVAESVIVPHISQALYDRILNKYSTDNPDFTADEAELLRRLRIVMARFGLVGYLPFGEVIIGNDGITTVGKGENRTAAYDQQITRLTESLLIQGHDALERLLTWLDNAERLTVFTEYATSDEYKRQQRGLIRRAVDFSDIYPIGSSRLTFKSIYPEMLNVEEDRLIPLISQLRYDQIKSGTNLDDSLASLKRASQKAIAFQSVANVIQLQQNIQLDGSGLRVYGTSANGSQNVKFYRAPSDSERSTALAAAQARADYYWDVVSETLLDITNPEHDNFTREIITTGPLTMF